MMLKTVAAIIPIQLTQIGNKHVPIKTATSVIIRNKWIIATIANTVPASRKAQFL
ncbi:MAG: hypothetical protein Q7J34_12155 [Bacteroidales bacterium]|nr:hypothetical protein [Bacteroidales bacterium]